jgi:Bifunctional DNA primase/polymerase, N-terminal
MRAHHGDLPGAARELAGRGWAVFPVRPGGKTPLVPAAHPDGDPAGRGCRGRCGRLGHGCHDATTDAAVIASWWSRWPSANIGVACGPSALLVVDLDGADAVAWWAGQVQRYGTGPTRTSATPRRGGYHLWYRHPARQLDQPARPRGGHPRRRRVRRGATISAGDGRLPVGAGTAGR